TGDIQPTLNDLQRICDQATDDQLIREYQEFWDTYDNQEQRVIRKQMVMREIWYDVVEGEDEESEEVVM
ncbi:MAG: hypothetical protein ABEJ65_03695, partial [bacterium]